MTSETPEMDMTNGQIIYLNNGNQIYLHTGTPAAGDLPVTTNILPDEPQLLLLGDGQIALTNGLPAMFLNPLSYSTDLQRDGYQDEFSNNPVLSLLVPDNYQPEQDDSTDTIDSQPLEGNENEGSVEEGESGDLSSMYDMVMTFKCKLCDLYTVDKKNLMEHIQTCHITPKEVEETASEHSNDGPEDLNIQEKLVFLCAQCAEAFDSLEILRRHMVEDHRLVTEEGDGHTEAGSSERSKQSPNNRQQRTKSLPKSLQQVFILNKNMQTEETQSKFKCVNLGCFAKFSSEKDLDIHYLCHNNEERNFHCCECRKLFTKWKPCVIHLWSAHQIDVGMYTCKTCEKKFPTTMKLSHHVRIHSNARNFTCNVCSKSFKQLSQLKNHSVIHRDRTSAEAVAIPKWYTAKECPICHKMFADSKCLKKHIAGIHNKLKPYSCTVCGHTCARKAMLQLHMRQHTGEKPYSCDVCSFKTGDHNSLRRHKMRHTGTKPYKCPYCNYSSIQSSSYKNHLKCKHPDQQGVVFECEQCTYRGISEEAFVNHKNDHWRKERQMQLAKLKQDTFPGNIAATKLIFNCLENVKRDGRSFKASIASQETSENGILETITIKIPVNEEDDGCIRVEDLVGDKTAQDEPDLGGITIPADESLHSMLKLPSEFVLLD